MKKTPTPEEVKKKQITKGKETRASMIRTLKNGNTAWGVYRYKWDFMSYAIPFDGRWRPLAVDATLVAEDMTKEQAEKFAHKSNIENRPKYEAMLEKERKRFNAYQDQQAKLSKAYAEKRKDV